MLAQEFFQREPIVVAQDLIGKVIRRKYQGLWLSAQIIETEAYYKNEKASHSSLGRTPSREATFMPAGTIYMYYARGGDSLNISCAGEGNAVLIKSARPFFDRKSPPKNLAIMQKLNPPQSRKGVRDLDEICAGQTLLCKSLALKVADWNKQQFSAKKFYFEDVGYRPQRLLQAMRLGIPDGRDGHLLYRFIDYDFADCATQNPLRKRSWRVGKDFLMHSRYLQS